VPRKALPTLGGFAVLGLFWGAWASVLPSVQRATGASKGQLGIALLFVTVGSLPAMLLVAGPAVDRFGTRATAIFGAAFAAATTLPGLAGSVPALALALFAAGASSGALDVGINASAARLEADYGRRLMPLAHGLYSAGVLVGAVAGGVARELGSGREPILLAVAVLVAAAAVWIGGERRPLGSGAPGRPRLERALLALGLIGAAAFVIEGSLESWSALFLERQLSAPPAVSGLGPGIFAGSMAAGRFSGQLLRASDRTLLACGAALGAVGCATVAVAPDAAVALAGLALGGAGVALNAPVVFGAAGRGRANPAAAVATVTTIGYLGLLVGPPLVGLVAQASSLRVSFVVLTGIGLAIVAAALGSHRLDREPPT
jgi:MFS family permease